jgi:transcriptional regulator with GAF, ATPase, and Fis domain
MTREGIALMSMTSRLLSSGLETQNMLNLILGMVIDVTGAERGFVILVDSEGRLHHKAARNIEDEEISSPEFQTSYTVVQEVISSGKPRLAEDVHGDPCLAGAKSVVDLGLRSILCVPIKSGDITIGAVYLDNITLEKRFTDDEKILLEAFADKIASPLELAVQHEMDKRKLERLDEEVKTKYSYANIVGRSKPMREVFQLLDKITDSDLSVYIYGETGTGKELIAKALHYNGKRKDGPFVSVNCGAIPEALLESELFGYMKGAFTGADSDKKGFFEFADGGTLFLDEISNMPAEMQMKLLRTLQENEVWPIGARQPAKVDVHVISASNRNLEDMVEDGSFRDDLFYRLNVVTIKLPPLRERREDIPLLVEHFIDRIANESDEKPKKITPEALNALVAEGWPGNVRELENRLRQAVALAAGDKITIEQVAGELASRMAPTEPLLRPAETLKEARDRIEKDLIITALKEVDYNYSAATKRLGLGRTWFYSRCKQLKIERK